MLALQGAFGLWSTTPRALLIVDEVLGGALAALVTARVFGDVANLTPAQVAERAFERSWAVIVLGFGIDLITLVGMSGLAGGGIVDTLLASGVLLMTATLMFAPVDATISDEPWARIVLSALSRSILAGWRSDVFPRALIVLALNEIAPSWVALVLQSALEALHAGQPALWASGLGITLVVPPVTTFATLVYLDAIKYEPKRTCGD